MRQTSTVLKIIECVNVHCVNDYRMCQKSTVTQNTPSLLRNDASVEEIVVNKALTFITEWAKSVDTAC